MYLDHAATTPLDPRVLTAMLPHLKNNWGNASSAHSYGQSARVAIDTARQNVADSFGVRPYEVVFTASGSESNNLAIIGSCLAWQKQTGKPGHLIVSDIEHKSVLHAAKHLKSMDWQVTWLPVDKFGLVEPSQIAAAITENTALVSIMWANNEVGTIEPIAEIQALCQERQITFHSDFVQGIGHLPLPSALPDLITLAGHKFYGPKGTGALIVRNEVGLEPLIVGGDHEFGLRAGTENTAGIVGFAKALELALAEQSQRAEQTLKLRQYLEDNLPPHVLINGHPKKRLPHLTSIHTPGKKGDLLAIKLDEAGIAISTGAACSTGAAHASYVLEAMSFSTAQAQENLRISLGKDTTKKDIDNFIKIFKLL